MQIKQYCCLYPILFCARHNFEMAALSRKQSRGLVCWWIALGEMICGNSKKIALKLK